MPSVAIIGAGWAGLTAAVRLADAGIRITLFESAKQLGGRARSFDWNGVRVDNGQHLLIGAYSSSLEIMQSVGVDVARALHRSPLNINVPGRLRLRLANLPAPFHLAAGLICAQGASLNEKLSAVRFMRSLQSARFRLPEDCSVTDWLNINRQHGTLRTHLWDSLCVAALNTRPENASAQIFANVLRDTLGGARHATDMLLPTTDLSQLFPEVAAQHLRKTGTEIHLSSRVVSIGDDPNGRWKVLTSDQTKNFDHVVIATGPQHASALLPQVPELRSIRALINELQWEPIATAYLQYTSDIRLPQPLLALNHGTTQWVADRGQLGGPAGMVAHVLSAQGEWEKLTNHELVAKLHAETNEIFCRYSTMPPLPPPKEYLVIREHRATFRCLPNLRRPPTSTPLPGLWLAGDYIACDYPGTLEAAVRSGNAVAEKIINEAVA